jgi:hypothetical protein
MARVGRIDPTRRLRPAMEADNRLADSARLSLLRTIASGKNEPERTTRRNTFCIKSGTPTNRTENVCCRSSVRATIVALREKLDRQTNHGILGMNVPQKTLNEEPFF